ncbi:serine aminopeptidase, s33 domain-containing protein [Sarocladium implicatum]|nr:serine aminopeptidase, s33 domain-containing protein [Sarocladium implicatum]
MATLGNALWPSEPSTALIVTTTAIATFGALFLGRTLGWPTRSKVIPNPLKVYPPGSPRRDELEKLIYNSDTFPGARDVETPYGSVRVYEWGPEDGTKVLFVHGISTSCITLMHIANALVKRGYRVMLFDLFGRGFTDGVGDLPHDPRLYVTQILLVLASSPLAWTGNNGFRLVGYSLGGGIAVHFANAFPHVVESLVLLAPAGLVRPENFGTVSRIVFSSGLIPESILAPLTRRRLQQPIAAPKMPHGTKPGDPQADMALAEAAEGPNEERLIPLEKYVLFYVRWMVSHHAGFVGSFMSCIRFSPLTHQHEYWAKLADRKPGTTAIYFAEKDEVIDSEYYAQQALPLVGGKGHVDWRVMPGAHDFVMTHTANIMVALDEFWAKD